MYQTLQHNSKNNFVKNLLDFTEKMTKMTKSIKNEK